MLQFSTHMELSRSMAAILEMPQYVAYQENVVYAFIKLSAKSHSFKFCAQWMALAALLSSGILFSKEGGGGKKEKKKKKKKPKTFKDVMKF